MSTESAADKGYEYDIFLSYRRTLETDPTLLSPSAKWIDQYFYPLLQEVASDTLSRPLKIFIDRKEINTGSNWDASLKKALKNSRCLLPVWSQSYFRSAWCLAEWHSMMEREQMLNFRTENNPEGLIFAIKFRGGDNFPDAAKAIQIRDFSDCRPAYRESPKFDKLEQRVEEIMPKLWQMIEQAPPWQPDFPIVDPETFEPMPKPKVPKPEF